MLVAEHRDGEVNVIGVSNAKSKGVKTELLLILKQLLQQSNLQSHRQKRKRHFIKSVNVGLPANLLQVEPTQGMIPVTSDTKEITDQDVENVVKSALTKEHDS